MNFVIQNKSGRQAIEASVVIDATGDGEEGLWYARSGDYDVIVLDLMLPGLDGLSILKRLREKNADAHVLILTAKDTTNPNDTVTFMRDSVPDSRRPF